MSRVLSVACVLSAVGALLACAGAATEPLVEPAPAEPVPAAPVPAAPAARVCPADPVALVEAAYAPYLHDGPFVPLGQAACWSASLQAAIDAEAAAAEREGGVGIGFDPIIDAQDFELAGLTVEAVDGDTVVAKFTNLGTAQAITWELVDEGGWRVDDLSNGAWHLRELLSPVPPRSERVGKRGKRRGG